MKAKLLILLAAGALLASSPAAIAQSLRCDRVVNGVPYSPYQAPDGTYNS